MAIEKKLIHFGKLADFEAQLTAGNILDYSIVFIQDAKKIWTHGTYYDCSEGTATGDEFWDEDLNGNAFCDRDILVDGNVRTNGAVVTSSIGVPLEEGGFATGDRGQILIATGEGTVEWDDISIPTKVSDLEDDRGLVSEQFARDLFIGRDKSNAGCEVANFDQIFSPDISLLYALPASANGDEDDVLLSRDSVKTINGESILGEGDLTIESGAKIYEWFYAGESESVTLSQEEYDNIVNADIVVVNFGGRLSCVVNKSGKEFAEAVGYYGLTGQVDIQGSKMLIDISINISTKLATITLTPQDIPTKTSQLENDSNFVTSDGLKTINGESILGSGDITISGGGSGEDIRYFTEFTVEDFIEACETNNTITYDTAELFTAMKSNKIICVPYRGYDKGFIVASYKSDENVEYPSMYLQKGDVEYYAWTGDSHELTGDFPIYNSVQVVEMAGGEVRFECLDNRIYKITDPVDYLFCSFSDVQKGTTIHFMSGTSGTTIEIYNVFWANGEIPQIEPDTYYELSIIQNAFYGCNVVLTPFKSVV